MSLIAQLIIGSILFVTVLGGIYAAWSNFKDHIGKPYAEAQRLEDQKIVDVANQKQAVAETDRKTAVENTGRCETSLQTQKDGEKKFKDLAESRLSDARNAKAQAQREAAAAAPKIAELQAKAAAQPKLMACEEELGKARTILQNSLRERRGIPTVTK